MQLSCPRSLGSWICHVTWKASCFRVWVPFQIFCEYLKCKATSGNLGKLYYVSKVVIAEDFSFMLQRFIDDNIVQFCCFIRKISHNISLVPLSLKLSYCSLWWWPMVSYIRQHWGNSAPRKCETCCTAAAAFNAKANWLYRWPDVMTTLGDLQSIALNKPYYMQRMSYSKK